MDTGDKFTFTFTWFIRPKNLTYLVSVLVVWMALNRH